MEKWFVDYNNLQGNRFTYNTLLVHKEPEDAVSDTTLVAMKNRCRYPNMDYSLNWIFPPRRPPKPIRNTTCPLLPLRYAPTTSKRNVLRMFSMPADTSK